METLRTGHLEPVHVESGASLGPASARELIEVVARTHAGREWVMVVGGSNSSGEDNGQVSPLPSHERE